MALFLSNFTNKIDSKGRISVPAAFRQAICDQKFLGVVVYESFINQSIEGCGIDRITQLSDSIDDLDPFSETRDAFATAILGGSVQLSFDGDGRIILPNSLIEFANLKDTATFVGKGVPMTWTCPSVGGFCVREMWTPRTPARLLRTQRN